MSSKCESPEEMKKFIRKNVDSNYQIFITGGEEFDYKEIESILLSDSAYQVMAIQPSTNIATIRDCHVIIGRTDKINEIMVELSDQLMIIMIAYSDEMLKRMSLNDEEFNKKVHQSRSYNETYGKVKEGIALRNMIKGKETKLAHVVIDFENEKTRREDDVSDVKLQSQETIQETQINSNIEDDKLEGVD